MDKYFKASKTSKPTRPTRATLKAVPEPEPDLSYTENAKILKLFDLEPRFGPSIGMTRKERWNRAQCLGLRPPSEVYEILEQNPDLEGIGFLEQQALSF